jgi:asparagine synthase (glutamine-hydrolysing)
LIAAVVDKCQQRHSETVAALQRIAGAPRGQTTVDGVTLLVWGGPRCASIRPEAGMAWTGDVPDGATAGPSTLDALRGEFGVIARNSETVRLARGHFGGRPLYYTVPRSDQSTVVCSRLGPLVTLVDGGCTLDRQYLAFMMAGISDHTRIERSPFAEIHRVGPGQVVDLGAGDVVTAASLPPPRPIPLASISPEAVARELRARLRSVMHRHLAGLERVAVLASGGVDSSAVLAACVAYAREHGRPRIDAFTVDVRGPGDDRPYFERLCRDLDVTPVHLTPTHWAPYVRRAWTLDATPCVWPNGAWDWPLLEAARSHGAEVVLTGVGGDDLYEGDPRLIGERARSGGLLDALIEALLMRAYWQPSAWGRVRDFVLRPLVTPWIPSTVRLARLRRLSARGLPWASPFARAVLAASCRLPRAPAKTGDAFVGDLAVSPYLADPIDVRERLEAKTGCVVRDPLFAPELVDVIASIPAEMLMHGQRLRGLFRLALAGLVPDEVRLRTDKAGFELALAEMLAAAGGLRAFADLSGAHALGELGLLEPRKFARAFEDAAGRNGTHGWSSWSHLWPVLALEAFARAHDANSWDIP